MRNAFVSSLLLVALLSACSKKDEQKAASAPSAPIPAPASVPTPAPAPAIPPPELIITNEPTTALPPLTNLQYATTEKGFAVKNAGSLFLTFPKSWPDSLMRVRENNKVLDAIRFLPPTGYEFAIMVEVINVGDANEEKLDIKAMRALLETNVQVELTNFVEKSLDIHDFQGPQMNGCYFVATDRNRTIAAPQPGQYLFLTQGYAKIGRLVLSFRLVSDHLSPEQEQMLEMIKTARFEKK